MDDIALIDQVLAGQTEAYSVLVDRHWARILNLSLMMTRDRHLAEDLAQETFARAYRALGQFQRKVKFSTWLSRIAENLYKSKLRSRARHGVAVRSRDEELEEMRAPESTQDLSDELFEKMAAALNELPYLYREAFVLRHLQELDYEDVASITGVPADTVRVRTHRAREMLREKM